MPRVTCPECEATIRLSEDAPAGKKVRCPKCEAVFRPDDESGDADDAPRRSRSEGGSSARKTPALLVIIPALAAAALVYGGTAAGVIIKERPKKEDPHVSLDSPPPAGPMAAKVGAGGPAPAPQAKTNQPAGPTIGKAAPEIDGEDIDGQRFKLSDYRGKVVLLDFWGHW